MLNGSTMGKVNCVDSCVWCLKPSVTPHLPPHLGKMGRSIEDMYIYIHIYMKKHLPALIQKNNSKVKNHREARAGH